MSAETLQFDVAALMARATGREEVAVATTVDFDAAAVDFSDLFEPTETVRFTVDPIIPEGEVTGLAGPGKTGKSQAALQIAIHVALGVEWRGMPVAQMPVVYLSAEDQSVILRNRMKAYAQWRASLSGDSDKTFNRKKVQANLIEALMTQLKIENMRGLGFSLTVQGKGGAEVNKAHVEQLAQWMQKQFPGKRVFVMFDTVGRFDEGAESNADYKALVMALDLLQKLSGSTVLLLAHTSQQATLEKRMDLTAMRGGLHLGNSVRSMLVMAGHRLGSKDEVLESQGVVPPMEKDLVQGFYDPLDIEGSPRGDRLSVIVHSDSNVGATRRPFWFLRGAYKGTGVLAPVDFAPDMAKRKAERAALKDAKKAEIAEKRLSGDCKAVLDYIRARQGDPAVYLTKTYLRTPPQGVEGVGFSKERVDAALKALGEVIETVEREDCREKRNTVVTVYRAAQEGA